MHTNPTLKNIDGYPYKKHSIEVNEAIEKAAIEFYEKMDKRRTVRDFSDKPIDKIVLENILKTASTAPSGAHKQPWTFCVISNKALKKQIREAAEVEEKKSYAGRMNAEWLQDLAPLGTNWEKPFLETAPYLIIVFRKNYELTKEGEKKQHYYVTESCGIACGFLLTAIHNAGLVALTHTPSPMNFLCKILNRPENEKPFLLIPVGYAAEDCYVPDIERKGLNEVSVWWE
jgi:iodotyrosine deiodinase